jgi:hypothetical protein
MSSFANQVLEREVNIKETTLKEVLTLIAEEKKLENTSKLVILIKEKTFTS